MMKKRLLFVSSIFMFPSTNLVFFSFLCDNQKLEQTYMRKVIFCKQTKKEEKKEDKCRHTTLINTRKNEEEEKKISQCLIYKIKQIDDNNINIQRRKQNNHPLFAGVMYLVVEDFSIGSEDVSITDSSYCSPSSLCFSSKKKKNEMQTSVRIQVQ